MARELKLLKFKYINHMYLLFNANMAQNCAAISALGVQIAPHQCVEVFSKIDEDGGGSITFGELCQWSEGFYLYLLPL